MRAQDMSNRIIARKIKTQDGYAVLVADDYAKTYVEFDQDPTSEEAWNSVLDTDEFRDVAEDVMTSPDGAYLFNISGNPMCEQRVFIFADDSV
jgi:hypothetical protein